MRDKAEIVAEQIYRVRRQHPEPWFDRDFYNAKWYLRTRLRSILGKNFVVIIEPRTVRVCYGSESVVI